MTPENIALAVAICVAVVILFLYLRPKRNDVPKLPETMNSRDFQKVHRDTLP